MQDDRWSQERDDDANGSDPERPYVDRKPRPNVRPAAKQPDRRGPPTPEEIQAFIAREYPETKKQKKTLVRPEGWDGVKPEEKEERGDAWEGDEK